MSLSGHNASIKLRENGQPVHNLKCDTHKHTSRLVFSIRVYCNCTEGLVNALTHSFQNYVPWNTGVPQDVNTFI